MRFSTRWLPPAAMLIVLLSTTTAFAAVVVTRSELSGGQLLVEGQGAAPDVTITIDGVALGTADGAGQFGIQASNFSSPTCQVTVSDGGTSAQATLAGCTPTAPPTPAGPSGPMPLAPAAGASLAEPLTISWSAVTDPAGINLYVWEVSANTTFKPVATQGFTNANSTQDTVTGLLNGTYSWHVKVINGAGAQSAFSATRSFTITGQAPGTPGTPTFTAPANLAQFHPSEFFTYTWAAVPGAASYRVEEDATDASFNAPEVTTANISGTSLNTGFGFVGTVYARVRGVAANGTLGLPSPTVQVNITYNAPIPPPPTPVSPTSAAQLALPVTFGWTDDPNPQPGGYELQIARDSAFTGDCGGVELCVRGITPSQYTVTSLTSGTKFWRVRSYHGDASPTTAAVTAWSAVRSLTVQTSAPSLVSFTIDVYGDGGVTLRSHTNAFSGTTADNMVFGNVQLSSPAPAGGTIVALSSRNTTVATVPASITVPVGTATASFRIEPLQVTASTTVTLTATLGAQAVSAPLTVDPPNLKRLDVGNGIGAVTVLGGSRPAALVVFNGLASAGSAVSLTSSNAAAATVPASLTVNADTASVSFTIATHNVTASTVVTITATWKGQSVQSQLTVAPDVAPTLLGPATGATFTAGQTITWDWSDVAGASTYTFQISDNSAFTSFVWNTSTGHPVSQATLPAGTMYWRVQAVDGFGFASPWSDVRSVTNSAGVTLSSLTVSPLSVTSGGSSQATVSLSGPAPGPFNGALVAQSSSDPSVASVPTSVQIPAGASSASFTVATQAVTTSTPVVITASFLGTTRTATLTVNPAGGSPGPTPSGLTVSPLSVTGSNPSQGTVTLSAAPAARTTLSLSSSNPAAAAVPASVDVAPGTTSATFTITTSSVSASTLVTLSASAAGVTKQATLTVTPVGAPPAPVHDVAVTGISAAGQVSLGDPLLVSVTVTNPGTAAETFPVTLRDSTAGVDIGSQSVSNLPAGSSRTLTLSWDTSSSGIGAHTLVASTALVGDSNPSNDSRNIVVTVQP